MAIFTTGQSGDRVKKVGSKTASLNLAASPIFTGVGPWLAAYDGTPEEMPIIGSSTWSRTNSPEDIGDESGNIYKQPGTIDRVLDLTSIELSKEALDAAVLLENGTFYVLKEVSKFVTGGKILMFVGVGNFINTTSLGAPGEVSNTYSFNVFAPGTDITVAIADLAPAANNFVGDLSTGAPTVILPKGEGFAWIEVDPI